MKSKPQKRDFIRNVEDQVTELHTAVGDAIGAFHNVESGLASCYALSLFPAGSGEVQFAYGSFFAADMFRTKLQLADTAVRLRGFRNDEQRHWEKLHKRSETMARSRNLIAHGACVIHSERNKSIVRWEGHMWDLRWEFRRKSSLDRPSLTTQNIRALTIEFKELGTDLLEFACRFQTTPS